jgi:PAS domain S-box-containing protein
MSFPSITYQHRYLVPMLFIFLKILVTAPASWANTPLLVDSDKGWPPYLQVDANGKPYGFAVDLLNAVAAEESLKLEWKVERWDRSMKRLASGDIDILPIVATSKEREKIFDFSDPILTSYDAVFTRRGELSIETLEDLKSSRILIINDDLAHEHLLDSKHYQALITAETGEEAIHRLAAGEADALLMSRLPGLTLIKKLGLDNVEALPLNVDWYVRIFFFAVTEGNTELLESLNHGLRKVRQSGAYDDLFDYWIASSDKAVIEQRKNMEILYLTLGIFFTALVIGAVFLLVLRKMVRDKTRSLYIEAKERKKAERKIAQQMYDLSFMRDALDHHAIVTRIDQNRLIENINSRGREISGFNNTEFIGRSFDELLFDKPNKRTHENIWSLLDKGIIWQGETTREVGDGDRIWLHTTIVPHINEDKRPDYFLAVSSDITRQKEVEIEQDQLKRRLQQAEKMESIGRLTGGIAHDFNNILASILGFTDLALSKYKGELNSKVIHYLEEVYSAGERARDLIAQMMEFSRTSSGESKELVLAKVVKETLNMLSPTLPSSINLDALYLSDNSLKIMMDPIKIQQVVMNLVINARDAMDGKGVISVGVQKVDCSGSVCASCHESLSKSYIELSIKDTGKGISEDSSHKIFDPFFTTKDIGKGTGMGLSVAHGIIHEHGGHILINNRDGGGCEFRVLFEASSTPDIPPESTLIMKEDKVCNNSLRLMVVDDDLIVGEYLEELFKTAGHKVSLHNSSLQAWEEFKDSTNSFDVLVTDQTMPGLLGTDLAQKVSALYADFPILLCTGYAEKEIDEKISGLNVTLFNKPVNSRQLLEAVCKNCLTEEG